jgi:hypothetical protein
MDRSSPRRAGSYFQAHRPNSRSPAFTHGKTSSAEFHYLTLKKWSYRQSAAPSIRALQIKSHRFVISLRIRTGTATFE